MAIPPSRSSPPRRAVGGRGAERGLTLIEILIVVAILGVIAALLVPNFLLTLQKAKQKRTMAEMHEVGKGMTSWLYDQVAGAAAGSSGTQFDIADYGPTIGLAELSVLLVPGYLPDVPADDSWGFSFEYYLMSENLNAERVMAIRSPGRDGEFSATYKIGAFNTTDFGQDLVWADGTFIRWPGSQ